MTISADFYAILTGGSPNPVRAIIGTRAYPNLAPQKPTLPMIVYTIIDGAPVVSTDGPSGLDGSTFQVDCYAETYAAMDALFDAVRTHLVGYVGGRTQGIFLVRKRDLYDDSAKLHRRTADFRVWNEESA